MHLTARLRRLPLIRLLMARPRLVIALAVAVLAYLLLPALVPLHSEARLLVAYDAGALLYILFAAQLMAGANEVGMRRRASRQDDGRVAVLVVAMLGAVASLVAIAAQLSVAKDLHGMARTGHILLAAATVVLSWTVTQVIFALHYAHVFYAAAAETGSGGLDFPGTSTPSYIDFFYVACVVGTSGQTADVSFSSSRMRRIGLVHCVLAYFFNATLLALSINIAAGLL